MMNEIRGIKGMVKHSTQCAGGSAQDAGRSAQDAVHSAQDVVRRTQCTVRTVRMSEHAVVPDFLSPVSCQLCIRSANLASSLSIHFSCFPSPFSLLFTSETDGAWARKN
jgi:hypothetical protein